MYIYISYIVYIIYIYIHCIDNIYIYIYCIDAAHPTPFGKNIKIDQPK